MPSTSSKKAQPLTAADLLHGHGYSNTTWACDSVAEDASRDDAPGPLPPVRSASRGTSFRRMGSGRIVPEPLAAAEPDGPAASADAPLVQNSGGSLDMGADKRNDSGIKVQSLGFPQETKMFTPWRRSLPLQPPASTFKSEPNSPPLQPPSSPIPPPPHAPRGPVGAGLLSVDGSSVGVYGPVGFRRARRASCTDATLAASRAAPSSPLPRSRLVSENPAGLCELPDVGGGLPRASSDVRGTDHHGLNRHLLVSAGGLASAGGHGSRVPHQATGQEAILAAAAAAVISKSGGSRVGSARRLSGTSSAAHEEFADACSLYADLLIDTADDGGGEAGWDHRQSNGGGGGVSKLIDPLRGASAALLSSSPLGRTRDPALGPLAPVPGTAPPGLNYSRSMPTQGAKFSLQLWRSAVAPLPGGLVASEPGCGTAGGTCPSSPTASPIHPFAAVEPSARSLGHLSEQLRPAARRRHSCTMLSSGGLSPAAAAALYGTGASENSMRPPSSGSSGGSSSWSLQGSGSDSAFRDGGAQPKSSVAARVAPDSLSPTRRRQQRFNVDRMATADASANARSLNRGAVVEAADVLQGEQDGPSRGVVATMLLRTSMSRRVGDASEADAGWSTRSPTPGLAAVSLDGGPGQPAAAPRSPQLSARESRSVLDGVRGKPSAKEPLRPSSQGGFSMAGVGGNADSAKPGGRQPSAPLSPTSPVRPAKLMARVLNHFDFFNK